MKKNLTGLQQKLIALDVLMQTNWAKKECKNIGKSGKEKNCQTNPFTTIINTFYN